MKRMSIEKSKQTIGGAAPVTIIWVAMLGVGMLLNSVTSIFNTVAEKVSPSPPSSGSGSSNKSYGNNSNYYVRFSPNPLRSTISFWM